MHALTAYLSQQLNQPIPQIHFSLAAAVLFLLTWLTYDFGAELRDKRLGRAMAIALLLCPGLPRSYLDGHAGELLGLLFLLAFLLYALRLLRAFNLADLVAAGLMLGAVVYANLSLTLLALLAFAALLIVVWIDQSSSSTPRSRWAISLGTPLVALLGIAPWLANNWSLIFPITPSPYPAQLGNLSEAVGGHGSIIALLAVYGIAIGIRANGLRRALSLTLLLWLLLTLEASLIGVIGNLLTPLGALTNAPNLARHGLILPCAWFGGLALLRIWETRLPLDLRLRLRRAAYPLMILVAALLLLLGANFGALLDAARPFLSLPPAALTHADVAAMTWLRDNTPQDALLLAADANGWLPVFAERRAVDFRAIRYFEWDQILDSPSEAAEPDFVFVPAGSDAPNETALTPIFARGGAQIYEVGSR